MPIGIWRFDTQIRDEAQRDTGWVAWGFGIIVGEGGESKGQLIRDLIDTMADTSSRSLVESSVAFLCRACILSHVHWVPGTYAQVD